MADGPSAEGGALGAFRVVGIVAMAGGFPPLTGGLPPPVILSQEYARAHPDATEALAVRLRGGRSDIAAFERELERLAGGEQVVTSNEVELTSVVQRGLAVQANALRVLAVLLGAVVVLLVGQALARQSALDADTHAVLRGLGATQGQLRALALTRALVVALAATVLAVLTAVALSPLTPVGVARHAELHPGLAVNAAYVGVGAVAVLVLVVTLGTLPALRPLGVASGGSRSASSRVAAALARAGLPASAVSGVRLARERGSGRAAVPVRSASVSVALAVATIAATLSFSAGLAELFASPRLYGWNWDVQIGDAFSPALDEDAARLTHHPAVEAVAMGTISRLQIQQLRVDTLAIEPLKGPIQPTVVQGRAPTAPTDVLLGTRTLRDLGVDVGASVDVSFGDRTARMRVVGRGVMTEFAGAARLGEGAAMTFEGMRRIAPDAVADLVLVRLRPGAENAGFLTELLDATPGNVYLPEKPSDLADLERIGGLPSVVAGILLVMAVGTLAHTLVTSVRRRQRDLAILKVLGFVRRQVSATVAWQSSAVVVVAVVVGIPLGSAAGRWAWQVFADHLGVPPRPETPVLALALLVPALVLLANLVAAVPARLAARTPPSLVLRTE